MGEPIDVNKDGVIVGNLGGDVVLWSRGQQRVIVRGAEAAAINNNNVVVGTKFRADGWRAFRWQNGHTRLLPGGVGRAFGISNTGWIVGAVGERPALWRRGRLTMIGASELPDGGYAMGVNSSGMVTGYTPTWRNSTGGLSSWLWWRRELTPLPERQGFATAIGNSGAIAGSYDFGDGQPASIIWPSPTTGGPAQLVVEGWIADSDGGARFVGNSSRGEERISVAFVRDDQPQVRYLRSVSGLFNGSEARGASRNGTVVGSSMASDGTMVPTLWRCAWWQAEPALPHFP
jgi:uncharacterized membrane protein